MEIGATFSYIPNHKRRVVRPNSRGGFVYVDESGDPGLHPTHLQKKPYFVFGYAYVRDPTDLDKRLRRLLKRLHVRDRYPPKLKELKFYIPHEWLTNHGYTNEQYDAYAARMPDIRKRVLRILAAHTDGVFAAVVDKRYARDWWTPTWLGNHAFAQTAVLGVLRAIKVDEQPAIIYDQGRISQSDESVFESYLLYKQFDFAFTHNVRHLHIPKPPHSVPSTGHPGIWAADYVAGAFYHKYQADDARYADMLRPVWFGKGEWMYWNRRPHGTSNWT